MTALKSLNMDAPLTLRPQDSPTFGIPSQKEIEEWIVKKKALALQEKYGIQMSS